MMGHDECSSGVTVSCSTDSSGCSSGDITEPGSPYSPASSAHSDDSHLAGPRMPTAAANHAPWPWATAAITPPPTTHTPSPSPRRASKRPRREPASASAATGAQDDFETLLDSCIKRSTNNNEQARPSRCCAPDIDKQGRITEYFKSQMKPFNNAKRDLVWNKANDTKKKTSKEKGEIVDDLEKYISYLSQNLNAKVPLKAQRVKKELHEKEKIENMSKVQNVTSSIVPSSLAQSNPSLRKLLEQENPATSTNKKKTQPKEHLSKLPTKKQTPVQTKRNIAPKTKTQSSKPMLLNKCRQKAGQTVTIPIKPAVSAELQKSFTQNREATQTNYTSFITSSPDCSPQKLNTLPNGLRQIMPINGTAIFNQMAITDRQNCNQLNTIPLQNNMSQHCNGAMTNANTQYPLMALPQGMMVMRLPPTGSATQQVNIPNNMSHPYGHNTNVNISSPTKLNNQFMFPFVQNFNGTVVQIPNIMTKVGQNIVIPNSPQQLTQHRQETVTAQQSSSHMVINGSLVKITNGVHTNFSGILTKPQQANANNFNFQNLNTHKNLNTGVPTMVVSKSNYPLNVGHQLLAPSSGFIINPMSNLITTQAQLNLEYSHTNMQNGMIITGAQNSISHNSSHISSNTMCNQLMNTSSVPIAPVKPPDEKARLPPSIPMNITASVPNVMIGNVLTSTTTVRDSITIYNTAQPTCSLPISTNFSAPNSVHKHFPEIRNTSTIVIESTTEKSVNSCQISNETCFVQKEVHRTSDSVSSGRKLEEVVCSLLEKRVERSSDSGKNGKSPVLVSLLEKLPSICSKENSQNVDIIKCLSNNCDTVPSPKSASELNFKPVVEYSSEKGCNFREPVVQHGECSRMETDFTEITLLKDNVLSSVHNSILESCNSSPSDDILNSLTDKSEVTDSSIDSPTESSTSKDCDDSFLNLILTDICSEKIESPLKSPILSVPKVIRFPANQSKHAGSSRNGRESSTTPPILACQWENCTQSFDADTDILEHLQMVHVNAQAGRENFVCLWLGCKVRGRPSCSRLWLERHALSHGGNKPFRCIVDNCGRRFTTQVLLEKHVNSHFNEQSSGLGNGRKSTESSGPKLIRRNGKKLRYRRQPWSARMFDYFDSGIMEGVRWRVAASTAWRTSGAWWPSADPRPHAVSARVARVMATRHAPQATPATLSTQQVLVRWHPPNLLEDEWISEDKVHIVRRVPIASLSAAAKVTLYDEFCASYRDHAHARPHACVKRETRSKSCKPGQTTRNKKSPQKSLADLLISARKHNVNKIKVKAELTGNTEYLEVKLEQESISPPLSGAAKRKQGRPQGGNAFWPSGR